MKKIALRFSDAAKQESVGRPSKLLIYARQSHTFSAGEKLWIRYNHGRRSVPKEQCFCPDSALHKEETKGKADVGVDERKKPRIGEEYQAILPLLLSVDERARERQRLQRAGFFHQQPEAITQRLPSFHFLLEFQRLVDSGNWRSAARSDKQQQPPRKKGKHGA